MATTTNISWTDHTFNAWIGCSKVSPGCTHCYAAAQDKLRKWTPSGWGPGKPRRRTSLSNWREPLKWNRVRFGQCLGCGHRGPMHTIPPAGGITHCPHCKVNGKVIDVRPRVFCASLADWLDDEVPIEWLADLLALIHECSELDWQLLTKRPENLRPRMHEVLNFLPSNNNITLHEARARTMAIGFLEDLGAPDACLHNVWVGTTVENQEYADRRIPKLLDIPAAVHFISVEPMLEPMQYYRDVWFRWLVFPDPARRWTICGGESGPHRRQFEIRWAEALADQCTRARIPFFMKQDSALHSGQQGRIPDALWHRKEFPTVAWASLPPPQLQPAAHS